MFGASQPPKTQIRPRVPFCRYSVGPRSFGRKLSVRPDSCGAARHPGRLRTLIVGTGGAAVPLELGQPLKGWVEDPDIEPYRSIDGRQVVATALSSLERYTPSETARYGEFKAIQ